jgi:hypothetical protein
MPAQRILGGGFGRGAKPPSEYGTLTELLDYWRERVRRALR